MLINFSSRYLNSCPRYTVVYFILCVYLNYTVLCDDCGQLSSRHMQMCAPDRNLVFKKCICPPGDRRSNKTYPFISLEGNPAWFCASAAQPVHCLVLE